MHACAAKDDFTGGVFVYISLILHGSEAFIGKASKGEVVVVVYFDPLVTQHMEVSGPPEG